MEIIRVEKNKNYSIICNEIYKNKKISLKAKGLLSLMLSLPENWNLTIKGLNTICKEGSSSIRSTLKELMLNGYITRICKRNKKGIIIGWDITIYESPKPDINYPVVENQLMDNQTQLNTKRIKDLNNKENTFLKKQNDFINEIKIFQKEFDNIDQMKSFIDYWIEPTQNKNNLRMRKDLQKTWDTKRRIDTWKRNSKTWNKKQKKQSSKVDELLHSHLGALDLLNKKYEGIN